MKMLMQKMKIRQYLRLKKSMLAIFCVIVLYFFLYPNTSMVPVTFERDLLNTFETFSFIQNYCGEVCNTTINPVKKGKYFDFVEKHVDCDSLFSDSIDGWKQPEGLPPHIEELVSK